MNLVDLLVIAVAVLAAFRGWRRGLLGLVFELGGGFIGLLVGFALGPRVADVFTRESGLTGLLISLFVVFACLSIGQTLGYIVGHRFGAYAHNLKLGGVNSVLGSIGGVVLTLVSFWLIGALVANSSFRELNRALARSAVLQELDSALPPPPNVLAYFSKYLNTTDFPQVFAGLPPPLSRPVNLPSKRTAQRAIQAADQSTVRIVVPACGGTQLGSGWVAADQTVVTNAHVVAGGGALEVQALDREPVSAQVVLFDQNTDVAIVRTSEALGVPVLELATEGFENGQPGATLGYPGSGNGQLDTDGAAVQARYTAVGRDIYGSAQVSREVYDLRSDVTQGESGGPFVLPDGRVAGVVFAASTTDANRGFALTGREVADEVERGINSTEAVSTGSCTG
ncbi:MAG: MarP family serine protease [Actinomycetota bacterium]